MLFAAVLVISRRPDAVTNAQFWAEDGTVFYANVYAHGLFATLVVPVGGYLNVLPVLVTGASQMVPLTIAALAMNVGAIAVQVLPVGLLLGRRATTVSPNFAVRILLCALYIGLPGAASVDANITDAAVHLAIVAALVLVLAPPQRVWGRVGDGAILLVCGLTGVFSIVLAPLAFLQRRRLGEEATPRWMATLLSGCAAVQLACIGLFSNRLPAGFVTGPRERIPLRASVSAFWQVLGTRVLTPSIIGVGPAGSLGGNVMIVGVGAVGLIGAYAAVRTGPPALRLFVLFGLGMLVLALVDPLDTTWSGLTQPPNGERYFVIPQLAVVATLVWLIGSGRPRFARAGALVAIAVSILLTMPAGWSYAPFADTSFSTQAEKFEAAKPGTLVILPLNPTPWQMALVKR
jgi:hypothetical protein